MLANRVNEITISPTMMVAAEAKKLKAKGVDIIDLSVGEPDFHTPNQIKDAGKIAIDENKTRYTLNQGTVELRTAIADKLKRENNLEYTLNEIIVSNGAKQSVFNSIFALINPGDEVIISAPYWVSYPSMISLAGGKSVVIHTDETTGFKITPDMLLKVITEKTKLLIICNPSNPTGAVYAQKELSNLADIVIKNNLYVLADEIYEKLVYDEARFFSFASVAPELKDRTIVVNGVSKSYAMTGWRVGYAAASEDIISAMNKIQSHTTSHASSISQHAAIEAIAGSQHVIKEMLNEFKERRDFFLNAISSINGINCYKPDGSFYLFPNITFYLNKKYNNKKIETSIDLAMFLLSESHVAVVPGSAFGGEGYLRMSYSTSMNNLKEAFNRIKLGLEKIL